MIKVMQHIHVVLNLEIPKQNRLQQEELKWDKEWVNCYILSIAVYGAEN
jgi:hypothetical protein